VLGFERRSVNELKAESNTGWYYSIDICSVTSVDKYSVDIYFFGCSGPVIFHRLHQ